MRKLRVISNPSAKPKPAFGTAKPSWDKTGLDKPKRAARFNWSTLRTALLAILFIAGLAHDLIIMIAHEAAGCTIKGNISINSGEPIYHVPGQENYAATEIRLIRGERWFCTEEQARAAGWRKAGR